MRLKAYSGLLPQTPATGNIEGELTSCPLRSTHPLKCQHGSEVLTKVPHLKLTPATWPAYGKFSQDHALPGKKSHLIYSSLHKL